jgi:hypothetical protein
MLASSLHLFEYSLQNEMPMAQHDMRFGAEKGSTSFANPKHEISTVYECQGSGLARTL